MVMMRTVTPKAWLRQGPAVTAQLMAVMPAGTEVELLDQGGEYSWVSYRDRTGNIYEGYVINSCLLPLVAPNGERGSELVARKREAELVSPWSEVKLPAGLLPAGMLLLLIVNLTTAVVLARGIKDLQGRSYSVSCPHGYTQPAPSWGRYETFSPDYYQDGKIKVVIKYQVFEKIPGSRIALRYRFSEQEQWREKQMLADAMPLLYHQEFVMNPEQRIYYQVVERVDGEVVRADYENEGR